jgi:hypothetical protein
MGRGRAKAKQTKVARDLKYQTRETDFSRLQRELRGEPEVIEPADVVDDDAGEDAYASGSSALRD